MNLDDYASFYNIDQQDMLAHIDGLPDQLAAAWDHGGKLSLPDWSGVERVVITGMGGSAIGGDLVSAYVDQQCSVPLVVVREYDLPAWVRGERTLVIASSHSGNTEETLSAFQVAQRRGCRILAICTGGELARMAAGSGAALWKFDHHGQPRAAVGFSFALLLAALSRLSLIPDPAEELQGAVAAMRLQQAGLRAEVPVVHNVAKRLAGQLVGRWVTVLGSGILAPVARRWKGQVSELAKAWAQFEVLPEADHNTLAGSRHPEEVLAKTTVLFLRSPYDHPRNRLRIELTQKRLMLGGLGTNFVDAQGDTPLANLWTVLHLGDYTAYYLAMSYEADPTPVAALETLKRDLKAAG